MTATNSVYVLGAGGIGCLVAAPLVKSFQVNLIVRNKAKIEYLRTHDNTVSFKQLFNDGKVETFRISNAYAAEDVPEKISNLVVSVKTFDTVRALTPLLPKIDKTTNIVLVQNGMGVIDELYEKLWPVPTTRPQFYQGVIAHGVFQEADEKNTYNFVHAGFSDIKVCKLPNELSKPGEIPGDGDITKAAPVVQGMCCPELNGKYHPYKDLLVYQVQKLLVNSCMNSCTSILDVINYELENEYTDGVFHEIVAEQMSIFPKALPILAESDLFEEVLDVNKLVAYTQLCGFKVNGQNSTSMHEDTLNCRDVEVDYINGYSVRLGAKIGIPAHVNRTIQLLVKSRLQVNRDRARSASANAGANLSQ